MDNLTLPGILENRVLVIARPEAGKGHLFTTQAGMVGIGICGLQPARRARPSHR